VTSQQRPRESPHSRDYVRRLLRAAADADAGRYRRATQPLLDKIVHVVVETVVDEEFYIAADDACLGVHARNAWQAQPDIVVRVSPKALRRILEGHETPVEAFFMGNLRARGSTKDLYILHAAFVALAEIAITSPDIQNIIEEFQAAKQDFDAGSP
jgi:SCP-2 sterol transfer family